MELNKLRDGDEGLPELIPMTIPPAPELDTTPDAMDTELYAVPPELMMVVTEVEAVGDGPPEINVEEAPPVPPELTIRVEKTEEEAEAGTLAGPPAPPPAAPPPLVPFPAVSLSGPPPAV